MINKRKNMMRLVFSLLISLLLFFSVMINGCSKKKDSYGSVEFSSINAYFAYMIEKAGSEPQMLVGKSDSPTGLGGVFAIPKCYRWGIALLTPLELEEFVAEANRCNCPELIIVDNGHFGQPELSMFKNIKSLRRIDLRFCDKVDDAVLAALSTNSTLEEIWLAESGQFTEAGIKSLNANNPNVVVKRGQADAMIDAIAEGRSEG